MANFGVGMDSTSQATDNRIAATDNARATRGTGNQVIDSGALSVGGKNAHLILPGGLDLSGTNFSKVKGGVTISTIPADFFANISEVLNSVGDQNQQTLEDLINAQNKNLDKVSELALSAQTGGDSERNKIVLWVALAALAVVGLMFVFGKRG